MKISTENIIKAALAVLLLLCLLDLPYGYNQLLRYIVVVGFAILAYYEYERKNIPFAIVFTALAILFAPFFKFGLGPQAWIIIDIVAAAGLILFIFIRRK